MSARIEAAGEALWVREHDNRPWYAPLDSYRDTYRRAAIDALAAADAVMFSDEAVERAAIALGVKQYPLIDGSWNDVDPDFRDKCRDQARAVIAALKGDDAVAG